MPGAEIRGQAQTRSFSAKHRDLETPRCLESQRYRNVHAHSRGFSTRVFSPTTHLPSATREPHAGGGQPPAPHVQTSHSPDRQGGRGSASHPPPTHTHTQPSEPGPGGTPRPPLPPRSTSISPVEAERGRYPRPGPHRQRRGPARPAARRGKRALQGERSLASPHRTGRRLFRVPTWSALLLAL